MSVARVGVSGRRRVRPAHGALAAILALSGLLEFVRLSQNGFANVYYSAAVKSMLRSWHNFFFIAADPHGLITVDKPPLGLWLQAASAKLFGFSPASLLIPEGICAILAVALLYRIVAPRFGSVAALLSAFTLAVFPSFVAVSRDNGVDPLLILLMLAACGAALTAIESGRPRTLIWTAVLIGLAFNTKSLAALLCIPGIAIAYLACAPGSPWQRCRALALAGVVFVAVAASWSLAVDLTPSSQRPFVGSSTSNSELQLTFGYNGFGRVGGQQGGPGTTKTVLTGAQIKPLVRPGVNSPPTPAERRFLASRHHSKPRVAPPPAPAPTGRPRLARPIPFGGARSPVRIFGTGLGDQAGWTVPLALIGMLAVAIVVRRRSDRRMAGLIVLGGWMLVELLALDFSAGIVHPYYASALGPCVAAMVGAGVVAIAALARSARTGQALAGYALACVAIVATVAVQLVLIDREGDPIWWRVPLAAITIVALLAVAENQRRAGCALGVAVAAVLVAPMVYSFSVWLAPVYGVFPTAGPYNYAGQGGVGVSARTTLADRALIRYLQAHQPANPYVLLTQSSDQAAPLILLGLPASAEGGYGASDPALGRERLASLVAAGKVRYFLIGGPYAARGGNGASNAARLVCPEVPLILWAHGATYGGSYLVDCAGRAAELRAPYAYARSFLAAHPKVRYSL